MTRHIRWIALAIVGFAGAGCVSQVQYDHLRDQYKEALVRVTDLEKMVADKDAALKAMRESQGATAADLQTKLEDALNKKRTLEDALAAAEARLRNLGKLDMALPPEVSKELQDLAAANPELLTFDAKRGMLKLAGDLTFDPGSVEIKPAAAAVLTKLAAIINSPAASKFEAQIIGHTDSVRISKPATLAHHPTNWFLSVHRAIAVRDALDKAGVKSERLMVGGYSMYRPVVPNVPGKGAAANRRVEIFLVPNTASSLEAGPEMPAGDGAAAPAPPPAAPERPAPAGPKPGDELYK
jgi:chemotaxis protein MotB